MAFTVRTQSRRSHLISCSIGCDESLLYACGSQSVFAWTMGNPAPILHSDDACLSGIAEVSANPVLPHVFMAVCKSLITIWDANLPSEPIHRLIIPVETPRIHIARWGPDGMSVFASDAAGGVYWFRVAEGPECRTMPQFFDTDFTVSAWVPEEGQIEESNGLPTHRQNRTVLFDADRLEIDNEFHPLALDETTVVPTVPPALKYAWLDEETWTRKLGGKDAERNREAPMTVRVTREPEPDSMSELGQESSEQDAFLPNSSTPERTDSDAGEI
jgi:hypothetical protein